MIRLFFVLVLLRIKPDRLKNLSGLLFGCDCEVEDYGKLVLNPTGF